MINQWRRKIYELGSWMGRLGMRVQTEDKLMLHCTSTRGGHERQQQEEIFLMGRALGVHQVIHFV